MVEAPPDNSAPQRREHDPEQVLAAYLDGKVSAQAVALASTPEILFSWAQRGAIDQKQFVQLLSFQESETIEIGHEEGARAHAASDHDQNRRFERLSADLQGFEVQREVEEATIEDLGKIPVTSGSGWRGAGLRMTFRIETKTQGTRTLLVELLVSGRPGGVPNMVFAEAAFSGDLLPKHEFFEVRALLPVRRGGRRHLMKTMVDAWSKNPLPLPEMAAEAMHESNLSSLTLCLPRSAAQTGMRGRLSGLASLFGKSE